MSLSKTGILLLIAPLIHLTGCATKKTEPDHSSGVMKLNYVICSSRETKYNVILENAAIGEPTALKLVDTKNGKWEDVTSRPITSIKNRDSKSNKDVSKEYRGEGFEAIRSTKVDQNRTRYDLLDLTLSLNGEKIKAQFNCSRVE